MVVVKFVCVKFVVIVVGVMILGLYLSVAVTFAIKFSTR